MKNEENDKMFKKFNFRLFILRIKNNKKNKNLDTQNSKISNLTNNKGTNYYLSLLKLKVIRSLKSNTCLPSPTDHLLRLYSAYLKVIMLLSRKGLLCI